MKKINTLFRNENVITVVIVGAIFLIAGTFTVLSVYW